MNNKKWLKCGDRYELVFTPFYDEVCVLAFCVDNEDLTCFWYVSEELRVEHDCIFADNIEEAKEIFEEMYTDYLNNQILYYETLLEKWEK